MDSFKLNVTIVLIDACAALTTYVNMTQKAGNKRRHNKNNSSERTQELAFRSLDPYEIGTEPEMQYQELSIKPLRENKDTTYTDLQEATT
ncbi:hypothetical protein MAR_031597 [Mya arenaria]|uniref:Uncharacterized protein n=1 Tax=Mya arenaria TaxID=6604 RepID=A0ABY7F8J7_MYAAR|nr:hypothetical protein MAR_031597 [Mya arenaria]